MQERLLDRILREDEVIRQCESDSQQFAKDCIQSYARAEAL